MYTHLTDIGMGRIYFVLLLLPGVPSNRDRQMAGGLWTFFFALLVVFVSFFFFPG